MTIGLSDVTFHIIPGQTQTVILPKITISGVVVNEDGTTQVTLLDLSAGALAQADGTGTSVWDLFAAKSGSVESLQQLLSGIDAGQLAKAAAGVAI